MVNKMINEIVDNDEDRGPGQRTHIITVFLGPIEWYAKKQTITQTIFQNITF